MGTAPPDLPGQTHDTPLDRALALLLADEPEAALRWSAAVVEGDASATALILTCRLLARLGRTEAAVEGFVLGVKRAIDAGNLPMAVAAAADLRSLGVPFAAYLDAIAIAFSVGSPRIDAADGGTPPPPLPQLEGFQPLSSFLTGPALLSKATQIIHGATRSYDEARDSALPLIAPLPLFSALEREALRALVEAFEMITVPSGHLVVEEGEEGAEAYIVARGELEVQRERPPASASVDGDGRDSRGATVVLARLTSGALFGEMALLSRAPRAANVVASRPSILLVARRDALEDVAERCPQVGAELAAHCRRRMVANLVRTSPVLVAVEPVARTALVERFETRVYEKGEKLIDSGEEPKGLHLIASGEVAIVGHDGGEPIVIATLGPGETVGEVALVLRRKSSADVVAVHPAVTLFLPREGFLTLVKEHPAILHRLYILAVQRDEETSSVLGSAITSVPDDYVLL